MHKTPDSVGGYARDDLTISLIIYFSVLFLLCLFVAELAVLDTHQDILIASSRSDVVRDNVFGVLFGSHPQVYELRIGRVQLLEGRLGLHD